MEPTSKSTSNLRTRAFVLLRKLDQNGSLTEAETYELVEIQTDLSTTSVKSETDSFKSIVDARFDSVDHRFDSVDHRFDSVDHRFDSVDQRLDSIDKRLDLVDKRFDLVDKRFDSVIKWLKIGITTGIGIILTMGGWLITLLLTGGS
ncbi:MAG: hypothetical protein OXE59_09790 [Bacteroidetes bacterium]|nr:hypothetical protein [Bacteroidota bacterium]MCY4234012.1 hypothetical protein [Bacteroidota bacterium]